MLELRDPFIQGALLGHLGGSVLALQLTQARLGQEGAAAGANANRDTP